MADGFVGFTQNEIDELMSQGEEREEDKPAVEFLTGVAGTGKSWMLKQRISDDPAYGILCATTGIAAVNLDTTTINALLGYYDTESLEDQYINGALIRKLVGLAGGGCRNLAIDEVSLLSGRQLEILYDAVRDANRRAAVKFPMGIVLTGDFAQLPVVKDRWAFESRVWDEFEAKTTKLTKVWRQTDARFLEGINAARRGDGKEAAKVLGECGVVFDKTGAKVSFPGTTIFAKNEQVGRFNQMKMDRLPGREMTFHSAKWGRQLSEWKQVPEKLALKEGALVMLLANRREDGEMVYANGSLGEVKGFEGANVLVELQGGGEVRVEPIERLVKVKDEPTSYDSKESYFDKREKKWVVGGVEYLPMRLGWGTTCHKCLTPETLIRGPHGGMLPISNVRIGDRILHVSDDGEVQAIARTEQVLWRVQTSMGYELRCSGEHRIATSSGFVAAQDLIEGEDRIRLGIPVAVEEYDNMTVITPELSWMLGALVGDGCYTDLKEGNVHFCCSDTWMIRRMVNWLAPYEKKFSYRTGVRSDGKGAFFTSKPMREFLLDIGLEYVKGPFKSVPNNVRLRQDRHVDFLRGLFDTNGSVGRSHVILTTASSILAEQVQLMLLGLGIPARRNSYPGAKDRYFQVCVTAVGLPLFKQMIGFSRPYKVEKLLTLLPNRIIAKFDGYDTVKSVECLNLTVPMIDLEMSSQKFIAGPFEVHNSQGLSLDNVQVDFSDAFFGQPNMAYVSLSRARTPGGLRVVGTPELLAKRVKVDEKVRRWI